MSHQVNFYLDPHDTEQLESVLRAVGPMLILHSESAHAEPRVLESVMHVEHGFRWLFYYLVMPEDLGAVVTTHVPTQGYWAVDVTKSPVIELNTCFFDDTLLRRGRLYYVDGFYDDNRRWEEKSLNFRKWAKAVLARTKRGLTKYKTDYVGTGAASWLVSSGGKLEI